jgi:hypothetical protein
MLMYPFVDSAIVASEIAHGVRYRGKSCRGYKEMLCSPVRRMIELSACFSNCSPYEEKLTSPLMQETSLQLCLRLAQLLLMALPFAGVRVLVAKSIKAYSGLISGLQLWVLQVYCSSSLSNT